MNLEEYAKSIPSMGGTQIGKYIREYVKQVPENTSIVELGTWMGAGTAQIALGLIEAGKDNHIYTYDRFIVSGRQPIKASWSGVELIDKEDSYLVAKEFLSKFPVNISIIKKEIRDSEYHGGPIGLYIDDACKQEKNFEATQRIFWRHFIPNVTVCIFMDYYLFEKTGSENHKIQYNYMHNHPNQFKLIKDRIEETYQDGEEYGAIFLYLGNN